MVEFPIAASLALCVYVDSPMDSLNNSTSKQGGGGGRDSRRRRGAAWGDVPSWKAGEQLLLTRSVAGHQQAGDRTDRDDDVDDDHGGWQALAVQQLLLKVTIAIPPAVPFGCSMTAP